MRATAAATINARRAFSLIELVIVVVIIAIIGAIAIPKMSRGTAGAADATLSQDLSILRTAADTFNAEHPTNQLSSVGVDGPTIIECLTQFSDSGATTFSTSKTTTCTFGPYLRAMPTMPVGSYRGDATIVLGSTPGTGPSGWLYTGTDFKCNDPGTDMDAAGNPYNGY